MDFADGTRIVHNLLTLRILAIKTEQVVVELVIYQNPLNQGKLIYATYYLYRPEPFEESERIEECIYYDGKVSNRKLLLALQAEVCEKFLMGRSDEWLFDAISDAYEQELQALQ
ncbi:hypothetical protein [Tumebacillus permanentifrigoris]|uniref:Uncharacterized protein n=1 Tax=Tumebacillus permanentifrigoris TaxID=378543 RepID=A0A316D4I2_9BACL|nr:hypothetical protein [Tumebacillus permanentifrigoris]PWK07476.1 hypothetical protein C7459_11775 [Tumebacillus permanentifrigoris]